MTTVADVASDIPGATTALQFVATKLKDFDLAGKSILAMQHQAAVLQGQAQAAGNLDAVQKLIDQRGRLAALYRIQGKVTDQLQPVRAWLSANGFGVVFIPVVIAVAAVAAVAAMTYVIEQARTEQEELDLVARGILTPEQLAKLRAAGGNRSLVNLDLGKLVPWAVGIGALYFGGPLLLQWLKTRGRRHVAA